MLLEKTRAKWKHKLKERIFAIGNFQSMLDANELLEQEWSMGFPGQIPEHRRFQITFLKSEGLAPHHRLLEIGCGPLTAGLPIIEHLDPGGYTGIDVRPTVLSMCWKTVGKAGLSHKNPRLLHSTSFGDNELGDARFDYIHSFSVLYHLSDQLLDACFAAVARRLTPSGKFIANVNTEMDSDRWLEFPFLKRSIADYEAAAGRVGLKVTNLGQLTALGFRLDGAERLNRMLRIEHA